MGVTIGILIGIVMIVLSFLFRDDLGTLRNIVLIWGTPLAILLALWRSLVAERQVKVAQAGLLSDRYRRAVEMLGHNFLSVRVGGIRTLRDFALEHNEYLLEVRNLLNIHRMGKNREFTVQDPNDGKTYPADEWEAKLAVEMLFEYEAASQANPVRHWWRRLLLWLKSLCKRS